MNSKKATISLLILLTGLAGISCSSGSNDKPLEIYSAQAVLMGSAAVPGSTRVQIGITRWTTQEEKGKFKAALAERGQGALQSELFNSDQAGYVKIGDSIGYPLRYADVDMEDGKRRLILATERAIDSLERMTASRSQDYAFSIVELILDDNGKGEGAMALGAQLRLKPGTGELVVKTYGTEPVRLLNVTRFD